MFRLTNIDDPGATQRNISEIQTHEWTSFWLQREVSSLMPLSLDVFVCGVMVEREVANGHWQGVKLGVQS